ncbi:MAG: hypothetical protein WBY88_07070, partial [Desulfosarcina sp.]
MSVKPNRYPSDSVAAGNGVREGALFLCGSLAAAACGYVAALGQGWSSALTAGILGLLAAGCYQLQFTGRRLTIVEAGQDFLLPAVLALCVRFDVGVWQVPRTLADPFILTGLTASLLACIYFLAVMHSLVVSHRHPRPALAATILVIPFLFNGLLILGATDLVGRIGDAFLFGMAHGPLSTVFVGRLLILSLFNEAIANLIALLVVRRPVRDVRLHGLLLGSALMVVFTPELADGGSGAYLAGLPWIAAVPMALFFGMLAQAGLWSQTFLVTGLIIDAIHGKPPTWTWGADHFRSGFTKGAVYSLVFIAMVHGLALLTRTDPLVALALAHPVWVAALIGALAFPLLKTIIETFDGSARFFQRAGRNYLQGIAWMRGIVLGAFCGWAFANQLPTADSSHRFLFGLLAGACGYGGVDLLRDGLEVLTGQRQRLQSWRVYALGVGLGGLAGGGLAWYVDILQLRVLTTKFSSYATLHYPAGGKLAADYIIYPLFSKWGALNLGHTPGGIRLFYNEALSGVINWSLAAPLFSINLVILNALLQRSRAPLKALFTREGVVALVEQAVRVLRWGLWMAPVIYSFLRMSPDPTWYNQDGAIRTLVATYQQMTLDPNDFRSWSLHVFLNLLVYDWFRILIWVDHMGLRVATLVNLSFVGADILDEKAARAIGFSARTRCMPLGLRRFATWAPLLIPFYLPRGEEWNMVWQTSAQRAAQMAGDAWPPASYVVGGFVLAASLMGFLGTVDRRRAPQTRDPSPDKAADKPGPPAENRPVVLSNGVYTTEVTADGRGYSRVFSAVKKGFELDLTRRPDDPLQMRGKFHYLLDRSDSSESPERCWSIGFNPVRHPEGQYRITQTGPLSAKMTATVGSMRADVDLHLDRTDPVEIRQVRLSNLGGRGRTIDLISYQEFGLNQTDAYRRHPFFNHLHIGTRFVRPLGALLAGNRLLKNSQRDPTRWRGSGETAFHAVLEDPRQGVTLVGYEDSRERFIGLETLQRPAGLDGHARDPADEGHGYSFDPIASLRLRVVLPPHGSVSVTFVDGYGADEHQALALVARYTGRRLPADVFAWPAFVRTRTLSPPAVQALEGIGDDADGCAFRFSAAGDELRVGVNTPRPWSHIMANGLGYGAVVSNQGACYSFMKNSQQNGLTPFDGDSVPAQLPGQIVYLLNLTTGETETPTFVPLRRTDRTFDARWGLGYAIYRSRSDAVELELSHFVLPDQPAEMRLLTIRNLGADPLHYRVVPYWQIVLGETPIDTRGRIETDHDRRLDALYFSNPHNDFWRGWAFAATSLTVMAVETARAKFVGGSGHDLSSPVMLHDGISDASQPDDGLRCAAFAGEVRVPPGGQLTVNLLFGQTRTREQAAAIIDQYRDVVEAKAAFIQTRQWWRRYLDKPGVHTGDPAVDRMVNFWLPYQVLVSRLWGRLGPYQRGGAFGFRDQLQDVLPFLSFKPGLARQQILLHAAQQFRYGGVLQWWHQSWEEKTGLGAHGRASDPHLWLPYMVYQYVRATGDREILNVKAPYLEGSTLEKTAATQVGAQRTARDRSTLYKHCLKAIELTLQRMGPHGLPLLGAGDWNDGLDAAGIRNRGESVWLGFFLYDILVNFSGLVVQCEGQDRGTHFLTLAAGLKCRLDATWRGDRYVNHFTDAGREMNRVNALVTAWSIISGAAGPERGRRAMATALYALERDDLVQLFTPPFTETDETYPGRLADYPPGVRENGGQYSHGVSWLVDALRYLSDEARERQETDLAAGYRNRAWELWRKISPLSHLTPEKMAGYGLPPHQQAADVYFGPGYAGRGGWSWYTGA